MSKKEALDILDTCDSSGEYKIEGIELGGDLWMDIAEEVTGENPYKGLSNEGDEKLWNFRVMIEEELGIELF